MEKISNTIKDKNFIWHMIGVTSNSFYPLFLIIFITRYNGIDSSGLFTFIFYFVSVMSTIGSYGGRIYQVSDISEEYKDGQYVTLRYMANILMFFVTIIFCLLNKYDMLKITMIFFLLFFRALESISDSYYGIMQKNNNMVSIGKSLTMKSLISFILFIVLNLLTKNILISTIAFIISNLLVYLFYDKQIVSKYTTVVNSLEKSIFKLIKKCFPIFLFSFFQLFLLNITRYFVDLELSNELQGYFGILIAPASIIALFAQFLIQPYIRKITELYHNKNYNIFKKIVKKIFVYLFSLGIIISLVTYLIGSQALSIIYGLDLVKYKVQLTIIIMGGIFSGSSFIYSTILNILRDFRSQMYVYFVSIVFSIVISIKMVNNYQLNGALIAFFLTMMFQWFIFVIIYIVKSNKMTD